jgi:hypothetical protein
MSCEDDVSGTDVPEVTAATDVAEGDLLVRPIERNSNLTILTSGPVPLFASADMFVHVRTDAPPANEIC